MSIDRPPVITQRASDIQQLHVTGETAAALAKRRADAAERMRRDKIRYERDSRRRAFEHHAQEQNSNEDDSENGGSILDVVA